MTELSNDRRADAVAELFEGPGEVRALARTIDWGATSLGWPDTWSPALRMATRAMLDAPFPICLWCGPEYALVYNDAYRRVLAAKHPAALGQPGSQVWAEIWGEIEWQFAQVRGGGAPTYFENARFEMARLEGGGVEEADVPVVAHGGRGQHQGAAGGEAQGLDLLAGARFACRRQGARRAADGEGMEVDTVVLRGQQVEAVGAERERAASDL